MTQAEYKRPRNPGRGKMAVVAFLVLVLCLACFALGIMVGGSGSESVANQSANPPSVTESVRKAPEASAALSAAVQGEAKQVARQQKQTSTQAQTTALDKAQDMNVKNETPAPVEKAVVQRVPLGSGINPQRKTRPAADVAEPQGAGQAEGSAQISGSTPALPQAPSVSAAESKKDSAATRVAAAKEGKYVVQIASFRAEADAQDLARKLKPEFPAYVREVDLSEKGIWFRVLVGPLAQSDEADEVQRRVKESTKLDGFVKRAP